MMTLKSLNICSQTYIGPVLVSLNPFKALNIYTEKEIDQYQGAVSYLFLINLFYGGKSN
jgi:hypothetical protein